MICWERGKKGERGDEREIAKCDTIRYYKIIKERVERGNKEVKKEG